MLLAYIIIGVMVSFVDHTFSYLKISDYRSMDIVFQTCWFVVGVIIWPFIILTWIIRALNYALDEDDY